jgi:hypothetical protein
MRGHPLGQGVGGNVAADRHAGSSEHAGRVWHRWAAASALRRRPTHTTAAARSGATVAGHGFGWSFSPDRGRLGAGSDVTAQLRLYDLRRLRVLGDVDLVKPTVNGLVFATRWASRSRVLAAVVSAGWLKPKAEAKAMQGPERRAVWLGDGRLAVTGVDYVASVDGHGNEQEVDKPAGLKLIDTSNWSVRTLDHTTSSITYADGVLFAFGTSWDSRTSKMTGSGVTAYDSRGDELYHRYDRQPIGVRHPAPRGSAGAAAVLDDAPRPLVDDEPDQLLRL